MPMPRSCSAIPPRNGSSTSIGERRRPRRPSRYSRASPAYDTVKPLVIEAIRNRS
jgi:hypothetical protein